MLELILGFGLGAMTFTEKGREIGNRIGDLAIGASKKVMSNAKAAKSTEQSPGTAGDNRSGC